MNPSSFSKNCDLNTPPDKFERQIYWIRKYFSVINPTQLSEMIASGTKPYPPCAMITFDDGYKSWLDYTMPYLSNEKIPGVFFLTGEVFNGGLITSGVLYYLGKHHEGFKEFCRRHFGTVQGPAFLRITPALYEEFFRTVHDREELEEKLREYCGEELKFADLNRFADSKFIFYGSHMWDHFNGKILTDNEIDTSLKLNFLFLSQFSNYCPFFSATFGIFNQRIGAIAIQNGFEAMFGLNTGTNTYPLTKVLKRISLASSVDTEDEFIFEMNKKFLRSFFPN